MIANQRVKHKLIIDRPHPSPDHKTLIHTIEKRKNDDKGLLDIIGIDLIDENKLIMRPKNKNTVKFQKGSLKFNTKKSKKSATKIDLKTQKSIRTIF